MESPPKPVSTANQSLYSIKSHFNEDCNVLLTGASGYIGSLIVEKLLRDTNVGHIYLLLRTRRGVSPQDRVAKLLQGPLFHLLDDKQASRVTAVAGDILEPGLGLSAEDESMLVEKIDTVVHSAADIRLDAPIHETLQANFRGSLCMTRLVARMAKLRSFVYVSTCYVNINKAPMSQVEERVYPLTLGGKEVDAAGVAEELLGLPVEEAEKLAAKYIDIWGFKNTYAMGKHLAEKAVVELVRQKKLPLCIVRPSLVSSVAAEPYAGYSGNFAGQVGGAAAYLVGLYNDQPEAAASDGSSVWDVVPGDVVAHATIAAAAAAASARARDHIMAPLQAADDAAAKAKGETARRLPMIVQVSSSCVNPVTFSEMFNAGVVWCTAHRRPFTLSFGRARGMEPSHKFNEKVCQSYMASSTSKVNWLVWVLRRMGGKQRLRMARTIEAGLRTFETINVQKYDLKLFFQAGSLTRLEDCLTTDDRDDFRIVFHKPNNTLAKALKPGQKLVLVASGGDDEAAAEQPTEQSGYGYGIAPEMMIKPDDDLATRRAKVKAVVAASKAGGWQLFLHNMVTFLWMTIYGKEVPTAAQLPAWRIQKLLPHLSDEEALRLGDVRHTYSAIKLKS